MSIDEIILLDLNETETARVDALARERGLGRDAMLLVLVREGLATCELAREIAGRMHGNGMSHRDS